MKRLNNCLRRFRISALLFVLFGLLAVGFLYGFAAAAMSQNIILTFPAVLAAFGCILGAKRQREIAQYWDAEYWREYHHLLDERERL